MNGINDSVEREYAIAILAACNRGDNDAAYWLQVGLDQYQSAYRTAVAE